MPRNLINKNPMKNHKMDGVRIMEYEVYEKLYPEESIDSLDPLKKVDLPLRQIGKIIGDLLPRPGDTNKAGIENTTREIKKIIREVLDQEVVAGDGDDWHNLSVDLARCGYYDLACDILERGLVDFPKNTDLLGDYLQYGVSCGRIEQCTACYKVLQKIPKIRYTWRGFHFSINWMIYLWEQTDSLKEMERLELEMKKMVAAYREYLPEDEESYRCEAELYKTLKDRHMEERALNAALNTGYPAPKCALRLAHIYFNRGRYEEALETAKLSLKYSNSIQDDINIAFVYYLCGLCRMGIYRGSNGLYSAEHVEEICGDFNLSLEADDRSRFLGQIKEKASLLRHQTIGDIPWHNYTKLMEILR